jgi:uncharacterized membrane protein YfcA
MAYGVTVHAAECFTTGFSGLSHHYFGHLDRTIVRQLLVPGVLGAILGAITGRSTRFSRWNQG